ncbi:hypothetical protein MPER_06839 [Moniliophthora perniciosa FA553]|nr:hypothetical protein MPER_06839 [Moniliophthora perniciosa FA553]
MHMQPIKGALTSAGNCSIPVTLIVLGAYFYPNKDENATIPTNGNGHTTTSMLESSSSSTLLQSVREMFHGKTNKTHDNSSWPGETKTFDLQRVFDDPVLVVIKCPFDIITSCTDTCSGMSFAITQAASGDAFERLISRTIFWSYCIVTPPATIIYVVIGLLLAKL